jgi:hypothetical protein
LKLRGEGAGDVLGIFGVGEKTTGNHELVFVNIILYYYTINLKKIMKY